MDNFNIKQILSNLSPDKYTHIVERHNMIIKIDDIIVPSYKQGVHRFCVMYGKPFYINDGDKLYVNTIFRYVNDGTTQKITVYNIPRKYKMVNNFFLTNASQIMSALYGDYYAKYYLDYQPGTSIIALPLLFLTQQITNLMEPLVSELNISIENDNPLVVFADCEQQIQTKTYEIYENDISKIISYNYIDFLDNISGLNNAYLPLPPVCGSFDVAVQTILKPELNIGPSSPPYIPPFPTPNIDTIGSLYVTLTNKQKENINQN